MMMINMCDNCRNTRFFNIQTLEYLSLSALCSVIKIIFSFSLTSFISELLLYSILGKVGFHIFSLLLKYSKILHLGEKELMKIRWIKVG